MVLFFSPHIDGNQWYHERDTVSKKYRSKAPYDWSALPNAIIDLLKDEYIIKIQSDVFTDKEWLEAGGVEVNSCVDTRLVFMFSQTFDGVSTGLETIIKHLLKLKYYPAPFDILWKASEITKKDSAMRHMCQDVRAAILAIYGVAEEFFIKEGSDNMMPIVYQLLFSFLDINKDPQKFSVPVNPIEGETRCRESSFPNPIMAVNFLFDTSPYYVRAQDYSLKDSMMPPATQRFVARRYIHEHALVARVKLNWDEQSAGRWSSVVVDMNEKKGWCHRCGEKIDDPQKDHRNCEKIREDCKYPLCDNPKSHNIIWCPTLHKICILCKRRGHVAADHRKGISLVALEYMAYHWSIFGKFTSVPYLEICERKHEVSFKHWRYFPMNQDQPQSQRAAAIVGIEYSEPTCVGKNLREKTVYESPESKRRRL